MVKGALSLSSLTASTYGVMTSTSRTFSLPLDAHLDLKTMHEILASGFSRIPVEAEPNSYVGYLLVKDLIGLNPADSIPLARLSMYIPICVLPTQSLATLLNEFQTGASHMAFISANPALLRSSLDAINLDLGLGVLPSERNLVGIRNSGLIGIVTLEDIFEALLTEEVYDEADVRVSRQRLSGWMRAVALPVLRRASSIRTSQNELLTESLIQINVPSKRASPSIIVGAHNQGFSERHQRRVNEQITSNLEESVPLGTRGPGRLYRSVEDSSAWFGSSH